MWIPTEEEKIGVGEYILFYLSDYFLREKTPRSAKMFVKMCRFRIACSYAVMAIIPNDKHTHNG